MHAVFFINSNYLMYIISLCSKKLLRPPLSILHVTFFRCDKNVFLHEKKQTKHVARNIYNFTLRVV